MSSEFQRKFDEEFLQSEKLRIIILTTLFSISVLYIGVTMKFFSHAFAGVLNPESMTTILCLQVALTLFEMTSLLYVMRRIRKNKKHIPIRLQYLNTLVEISFPAVMMLALSKTFPVPAQILHSPVASSYFIFIVLSTLRLNFRLSVFSGVLAAVQYFVLTIYLLGLQPAPGNHFIFLDTYSIHLSKALTLLFGGIAAGFVSKQISSSITRSLNESEKKKRVVNLFRQQLSSTVVDDMLKTNGSMESKRVNASVMFIDIRDFTKYVSDKIVIESVTKHEGIINQFLGDGCMATFGAPQSLDNPGKNAVDAALEIKQRIAAEIENKKLPHTRIGVGIHTGEVVTGNIGNETRQQYSITGGVVIIAARIEQLNKEFKSQILVSEDVVKSMNGSFVHKSEHLGKISLKGYDQAIGIYKLA
jgi:adenylate cyclase